MAIPTCKICCKELLTENDSYVVALPYSGYHFFCHACGDYFINMRKALNKIKEEQSGTS